MSSLNTSFDNKIHDAVSVAQFLEDLPQIVRLLKTFEPFDHQEFFQKFPWSTYNGLAATQYLALNTSVFQSPKNPTLLEHLKKRVSTQEIYYDRATPYKTTLPLWQKALAEVTSKTDPKLLAHTLTLIRSACTNIPQKQWDNTVADLLDRAAHLSPQFPSTLSQTTFKNWQLHRSKKTVPDHIQKSIDKKALALQKQNAIFRQERAIDRSLEDIQRCIEQTAEPPKQKTLDTFAKASATVKYQFLEQILFSSSVFENNFLQRLKHVNKILTPYLSDTPFPSGTFYYRLNYIVKNDLSMLEEVYKNLTLQQKKELKTFYMICKATSTFQGAPQNKTTQELVALLDKENILPFFPQQLSIIYQAAFSIAYLVKKDQFESAYQIFQDCARKGQVSEPLSGFFETMCEVHQIPLSQTPSLKIPKVIIGEYHGSIKDFFKKYNDAASKKALNQKIRQSLKNTRPLQENASSKASPSLTKKM